MNARLVQRPDWRATGARPARLAAHLFSIAPSSGISISVAKAVVAPMAWDAGADVEAELQAGIGTAQRRKSRVDRRDLMIDPPKPLGGLALAQTGAPRVFPAKRTKLNAAARSFTSARRAACNSFISSRVLAS